MNATGGDKRDRCGGDRHLNKGDRHRDKGDRHLNRGDRHLDKGDRHRDKVDRHVKKGDRHLDKGDRHLDKAEDRHTEGHDRHKNKVDGGHLCICGYHTCAQLRFEFIGTGHAYDRSPYIFTKYDDPLWDDFEDSLLRNLHVSEEKKEMVLSQESGSRIPVAGHHFTEAVVKKYMGDDPKRKGIWKLRFDRKEAEALLHLPLDPRDTDDDGRFFVNANSPVLDAVNLLASIKSGRAERASGRSVETDDDDSTAERNRELQVELERCLSLIDALKKENHMLKQTSKRRKAKVKSVCTKNKQLKEEMGEVLTMDDVTGILRKVGGMTRMTLFDK